MDLPVASSHMNGAGVNFFPLDLPLQTCRPPAAPQQVLLDNEREHASPQPCRDSGCVPACSPSVSTSTPSKARGYTLVHRHLPATRQRREHRLTSLRSVVQWSTSVLLAGFLSSE